MGTSVAAYFVYNIRISNFFGGPVTFEIYWPPGPEDTKAKRQGLIEGLYRVKRDSDVSYDAYLDDVD